MPSSIRLHYENTSCGGIDAPVDSRKSFHVADTDGNGLPELEACFAQENLAALLPCLPPGTNTVTLENLECHITTLNAGEMPHPPSNANANTDTAPPMIFSF